MNLIISLLILCAIPIINFVSVKKIKSAYDNEKAKERGYWVIYLVYWLITIPIILLNQTHFISPQNPFNTVWNIIIWLLIAFSIFSIVLPILLLPFVKSLREKVADNYDAKLYPVTGRQQLMFVGVAVTVGVCEEIMFRGFLHHFVVGLGLSDLWAVSLISVIFGAGHFLQGVSGIISSTIFGLIMGYLYFTTGSLLVPIIIHILYDAKAIYITRVLQNTGRQLWK